MRLAVALLILALPIAEIVGLFKVGQIIGLWPTIGLLIAAGVAGVAVLNVQGLSTMRGLSAAMERGETPMRPMVEGLLLSIAGLLLIVPGFIGDAVALLLLVPPLRRLAAAGLLRWVMRNADIHVETFDGSVHRRSPGGAANVQDTGPVIEGEFTRIGDRPISSRPGGRDGEGTSSR